MIMYQKILVPLDGSKRAEAALPTATAFLSPNGTLVLVRVLTDLWIDDPLTPAQRDAYLDQIKQKYHEYLDGVAQALHQDNLGKKSFEVNVLVASGEPSDQILEIAQLAHADLIAMATHGYSGLQRVMLGSVAEKIVHQSELPVLLVRPEDNLDAAVVAAAEADAAAAGQSAAGLAPWSLTAEAMPESDPHARLQYLLRYAILAPSTHNSQPWRFAVAGDEIHLYVDRTRRLKVADADEREMYVSIGCALENLLVAAEHFGYQHAVTLIPDVAHRDLVASVRLTSGGTPASYRAGLFNSIAERFSNHAAYSGSPIDSNTLTLLQNVCVEPDLKLMLITDDATRQAIDGLIARADAVQFADPAFREELGYWIGQGAFGNSWLMSKLEQMAVVTLNLGDRTARQDSQALLSAPVFGVITSQADDRPSQIRAGQVYERMHLLATRLRLSVQPMNQLLQQRYFKSALSDTLFAERLKVPFISSHQPVVMNPALQMTFRLGYSKAKAVHTPRRALKDVLIESVAAPLPAMN